MKACGSNVSSGPTACAGPHARGSRLGQSLPPPPDAREPWLAAAACALLAAALFAPALFGDRCTLAFELADPRLDVRPWTHAPEGPLPDINPLTPDTDLYVLPGWIRARELARGDGRAWWDDAQLCGYPLGANMPVPLFHPAVWAAGLLPPVTALDVLLWFHVALAAFLAFRAARMLGAGPPAAAVAAVGFSLSAWMTTRWHLPHILYAAACAPGVLAAFVALRAGRRRRALLEGAVWLGLSLLAFPQVGAVLALGLVALALLDPAARKPGRLLVVGAAILLGGLLAAPQLQLSGKAYAASLRASEATRDATALQGLPAGALGAALLPERFGRPSDFARPGAPVTDMKAWLPQRLLFSEDTQDNVVENAVYPGLLVLLLLGVALARGAPTDARRLLALGAGALLLSVAWPMLARAVPGMAALAAGNAKRLMVLVACTLPFAAALALQALMDGRARPGRVLPAVLFVLLLAAPFLAGRIDDPEAPLFAASLEPQVWRQGLLLGAGVLAVLAAARRGLWAWLPAFVLAADLAVLGLVFNPFPPQQPPFPTTPAIAELRAAGGRLAVLGAPNLLPPTAAAVCGLQSLHGVAALVPRRTAELLACIEGPLFDERDPRVGRPFHDAQSLTHPVLDLLAVDVVVHADPGLAAATGWPVLFEHPQEGLAALRRPSAGPRAFLCGGARVVPDDAERLAVLADRAFAPHRSVIVEEDLATPLPVEGRMVPVRVERPRPDVAELAVEAPWPGLVVLAESWSEGWRVRVDGEPAEALVADHALLGVAVGSGAHRIEWSYEPPGLRSGWLLLGMGVAGLAVVAWFGRREPPMPAAGPGGPA